MSEAVAALMSDLEAAARAAWQDEEALRNQFLREIARLERRRAFAHRRMNFVRVLLAATGADVAQDDAAAAQRAAARRELGWLHEGDFHRDVLDRLQPVGRAIWLSATGQTGDASAVHSELEAFETWFEATYREPFYALFDRETLEAVLVEA